MKENMTTDPQGELLIQVDENNIVIGSIQRGLAHESSGIFYRTIYVLVINGNDEVLIHKRSETKDLYPNCWDLSVGGHVNYQDSYEETAARELREELGLEVFEEDLLSKGEVLVKLPNSGEFFNVYEYHLKSGDKIWIHSGPFSGYEAIFDVRLPGKERVRVLLKFLGDPREVPIELDISQIRKDD